MFYLLLMSSFSTSPIFQRCYWPSSLSSVNGISDYPSTDKLLVRVRCFSSAGLPSHMVLEMPSLSPTMNQGNIAKWRKKEGDKIDVGDVLCEIETDKAVLEFECLEEGQYYYACWFLAKILAPEGSKDVLVRQSIAITVEDADDITKIPGDISKGAEPKQEKAIEESSKNVEKIGGTQDGKFSRMFGIEELRKVRY